ncbi:MAG: hypothetical protein AB2766_11585 [Candidatus Thiodiazotropha endolucinida]
MNDHNRWTDEKLSEFYEEFKQHRVEEKDKWDEILKAVRENAECTKRNSEAIAEINDKTEGMISAWETYQSGVKIAFGMGKVADWIKSLSIYAFIIAWITGHIKIGGGG